MFTKIDEKLLSALRNIVGDKNVLTDVEDIEPYSHDEVAELNVVPEAVVRARSTDQVSRVMQLASNEHFPVTPRGAGKGLSGGAVAVDGGIVLSLEKMNEILEIDEENLMARVQPGVITGDLHRAVEAVGLFYPPDPASLDSCSLGGNIAENAGGPRAIKYGVTHNYVCGLTAVLPSGAVTHLGGKVVKNVTGYDLLQLLIGSEGTLGIVTEATLRLIPLPQNRIDLLVPFDDFRKAAESVSAIIKSRIVPVALEFMERDSILAVEKLKDMEVPYSEAAAHLLITLDGNDENYLEEECEKIGEICLEHDAIEVLVADNSQIREQLWSARKLIIEALQALSPERIMDTQDIVVPRTELPVLLDRIKEVADRYGLNIINFGHSGDGNVHVNIIKDMPEEQWKRDAPKAAEEIYRIAISLGGKITGEHGIGVTRKGVLSLGADEAQIEIMKGIKTALDPHGILNPGKILS